MLSVKPILFFLLAVMVSGSAWAHGGGFGGFHGGGGGFHRGGGWHTGGGGWHGAPGFRGFGGYPRGGWQGSWQYGRNPYWGGRYLAHPGFGFFVGAYPYWPSYGNYWPYYSYGLDYNPNIAAIPSRPPVYIEQGSAPSIQALELGQWKFCAKPEGYYPYIKDCAEEWQQLATQPQDQEPGYWYYCNAPAGYYPYVRECGSPWRKIVP